MSLYSLVSSYENSYVAENFFNRSLFESFIDKLSRKAHVDEFKSGRNNPIYAVRFGKAPKSMISFAGVHGNEIEPMNGVTRMLEMLYEGEFGWLLDDIAYVGVPVLNPDRAGRSRRNAHLRNINRDFGKYGPMKILGSRFRTQEARAAREIITKHYPALVIDHHADILEDFYTEEYGETNEAKKIVSIVGKNIRAAVREGDDYGLAPNVYQFLISKDLYNPEKKGMLVNYASHFCPAILVECSFSKLHTIADVAALQTLASLSKKA